MPMRRLWWMHAAVVAGAVALCGCKNAGTPGGDAGGVMIDPVPTSESGAGDDVWTPEAASDAIGEAAAEAAVAAQGDRAAVIEAATAGAVDQAMLVAPSVGIDASWAALVREEIGKGVTASDSLAGVVVDRAAIQNGVRSRTLTWILAH